MLQNNYYCGQIKAVGTGVNNAYTDLEGGAETRPASEFTDGTIAKLLGEPFVQRTGIDTYPTLPIAAKTVVVAELERDTYAAGETVTANIYLVGGDRANVMGYGLKYNADVMVYQSAEAGENLSITSSAIDKNTGSVVRELHVTPGTSIQRDEDGRIRIDTLTFAMTSDGNVGISFAPVEDATDVPNEGAYALVESKELETIVKVTYLTTAEDDMAKAANVDQLIGAIGEPVYAYGDAIQAAREAYDALTNIQKTYVTKFAEFETKEATYNFWLLGDANLNGVVNANDLSLLLSAYGTDKASCDFNRSGTVDAADLSVLLVNYKTKIA